MPTGRLFLVTRNLGSEVLPFHLKDWPSVVGALPNITADLLSEAAPVEVGDANSSPAQSCHYFFKVTVRDGGIAPERRPSRAREVAEEIEKIDWAEGKCSCRSRARSRRKPCLIATTWGAGLCQVSRARRVRRKYERRCSAPIRFQTDGHAIGRGNCAAAKGAVQVPDLGPGKGTYGSSSLYVGDQNRRIFLRSAKPVAARVEREHQWPAQTILSQGH